MYYVSRRKVWTLPHGTQALHSSSAVHVSFRSVWCLCASSVLTTSSAVCQEQLVFELLWWNRMLCAIMFWVFYKIFCGKTRGRNQLFKSHCFRKCIDFFCAEKYIFDVLKEACFTFPHVSVMTGQVLGNRPFTLSSFEVSVLCLSSPATACTRQSPLWIFHCMWGSFRQCMNHPLAQVDFCSDLDSGPWQSP